MTLHLCVTDHNFDQEPSEDTNFHHQIIKVIDSADLVRVNITYKEGCKNIG